MVETYGSGEQRFYYVTEGNFGETPATPAMLGAPADLIDPGIDPGNIKLRGAGNYDLQAIKKGLRQVSCKVGYPLPGEAPIDLLQWARVEVNKSLSIECIYYKGIFASATDIISLLFKGMRINKATVECSVEDVIRANLELEGQDVSPGIAKIGTSYADYAGAVAFHESYVKKGTTPLDRVSAWKFVIENNVKRVPVIRATNGYLAKYIPFRHRNLSGEVTFEFESKEEADDVLGDTPFDLEFGLGKVATVDKKATFTACKWDNVSIPSRMEDLLSLKAVFTAKGPLLIA